MRRLFAIGLVVVLTLAACGGDSSGDDGGDVQPNNTQAPADENGDDPALPTTVAAEGDQGLGNDVDGDVSSATVTVGGETYEFVDSGFPGLQCMPSAFGVAFLAALQHAEGEVDGKIGSIVVGIPFVGEEETAGIMPELSFSVGNLEWTANEERAAERNIPAGSSQVDSYDIDGNTITGTATFYEESSSFSGDLVVETGTFEVTCVES